MKFNNTIKLIVSIAISEAAGVIGSLFTTSAIPIWYADLQKPALNPPGWIFGPVWTILYLLMGISLFLVWRRGTENKDARTAIVLFAAQLILNAFWTIIFFGLHNPALAFVEIVVLLAAIIWTTVLFYKISRVAGILLLPYILWVSFAAYLNFAIWQLNR
ncbi:MAG: TspO/MBR family protein [Candidatus Liptonbacteria bacterium]|nr:TspO/MBR family protein [Candidatus Liptonbacteria bacterium]